MKKTKRKDVFWFIVLRLIIITALAISALAIQFSTPEPLLPNSFYYFILISFFLSFIYYLLYSWGNYVTFQVYVQIVFDLLLITSLVYVFGGLKGSFYFLYIFEIIAASIVLSNRAAYITAALSAIFFGFLVDTMYLGILPYSHKELHSEITLGLVINDLFIAWSVFFLVAFLINYLSENLRNTRIVLRETRRELEIKKHLAVAGEVSAHLAHEIRNPLAAISGSVQVLRDELELTGDQKDLMTIVVNESARVSHSIEQFLNLASPGDLSFKPIDLSAILKETLLLLQRSGEMDGNFHVKGNFKSAEVSCYGNSSQFKQVFWNILKNAFKAMPEGGTLTIDFMQKKKNEIQLKFNDTGRGLSDEEKERLFEPFYSGFKTGKGIGMSVVKRIVEDYNGKIQIFSEPNKGTEIVITLPQGDLGKNKKR